MLSSAYRMDTTILCKATNFISLQDMRMIRDGVQKKGASFKTDNVRKGMHGLQQTADQTKLN